LDADRSPRIPRGELEHEDEQGATCAAGAAAHEALANSFRKCQAASYAIFGKAAGESGAVSSAREHPNVEKPPPVGNSVRNRNNRHDEIFLPTDFA
jgi:hypothetical protein